MKYKVDVDNVYFHNVPKKVLECLRDEEIDDNNITPVMGWVKNESYVDVESEFNGGCVQLWGIPLRLLIHIIE